MALWDYTDIRWTPYDEDDEADREERDPGKVGED